MWKFASVAKGLELVSIGESVDLLLDPSQFFARSIATLDRRAVGQDVQSEQEGITHRRRPQDITVVNCMHMHRQIDSVGNRGFFCSQGNRGCSILPGDGERAQ